MPRGKGQQFHLLPELDAAIIATLPPEGAKMGWQILGTQIKAVAKELNKVAPITSAQISARLRGLQHHGLIVPVTVQPVSNGRGWQRTEKGTQFAAEHGATLNNDKG